MEPGSLFSDAMPSSNANMFQPITSSQSTTVSVTFGVPTIASMTQKVCNAPQPVAAATAAATSRPAELTAAYVHQVKNTQTKVEEADSESSMPCSLPDDIANRYARYFCYITLVPFVTLLYSADAMGTVLDHTAAAATATM